MKQLIIGAFCLALLFAGFARREDPVGSRSLTRDRAVISAVYHPQSDSPKLQRAAWGWGDYYGGWGSYYGGWGGCCGDSGWSWGYPSYSYYGGYYPSYSSYYGSYSPYSYGYTYGTPYYTGYGSYGGCGCY